MKKLSFLFALVALLGLNVACNDNTGNEDAYEKEEERPVKEAGKNFGEGVREAGENADGKVD